MKMLRHLKEFCRGQIRRLKFERRLAKIRAYNTIELPPDAFRFFKINIDGRGNEVRLSHIKCLSPATKIFITIYGDRNRIECHDSVSVAQELSISLGQNHPYFGKCCESSFSMDGKSSIENLRYITYNSHAFCKIGAGCMLSVATIYNTDAHPIFDLRSRELINRVRGVEIGEHCWIGMNATILKNVSIPKGCIVGYGSIVCASHEKLPENCILAGVPARVVKRGIDWSPNGAAHGYIDNDPLSDS